MNFISRTLIGLFPVLLIASCTGEMPVRNEVVIHELGDPETMNPVNFTDATSGYITNNIFQKLIDVDFRNSEQLVGILAEGRPQIETTPDGKLLLTFRLRKEARWDNGTAVTPHDVEFSLKTLLCPLVNDPNARPVFSFISDFKYDSDDSLRFTVIANQPYFLAESAFSDIPILPEYSYDPKGLMRKFTLRQITGEKEKVSSDPDAKAFADDFNSEKRMRDAQFISGSGAYRFTEWKTNERVVLVKKKDWWGNSLEKENCYFESYPDKLIYQIIKDQTTALVSLKAGNIDVMRSIKTKDFVELPKSEKFVKNFNTYTPPMFAYTYIGMNNRSKFFTDKLTRQAMEHLADVDKMIQTVKYGMAQRVIGPIHPLKKKEYNSGIVPYDYNLEKAKQLLEKAGWKNTNGDETLDKVIDGKTTEFVVDLRINAESDEKKTIAILLQAEAKKVGIKINIVATDFAVFIEKCRKHEFDMNISSWVMGPPPDDLSQNYYTESAGREGSNFENFSNAEADALMDSIRVELDAQKRSRMYLRIQEILHEEAPKIFLWVRTEQLAISKRFDNAYPSEMRPGYWASGFKAKALGN